MKKDPFSELTRDVLNGRRHAGQRRILIEKISRIVYAYPKKHLHWDDDDSADFFCDFYPKIEGLIDRFTYQGKPFEAYLASSVRWQLKTFAKKRVMQHAESRAICDESGFWYVHDAEAEYRRPDGRACNPTIDEHADDRFTEVARVLKIEQEGKIGDPAWSRRLLYLLLRNVVYIDDSLIEHCARISGYDPDFILGRAAELKERLAGKQHRYRMLLEKRNTLHIRLLQLGSLLSNETDGERLSNYEKQITSVKARIAKLSADIKSSPLLATHKDIAEVLGTAKGSVDSGLYYLRKAFEGFELN